MDQSVCARVENFRGGVVHMQLSVTWRCLHANLKHKEQLSE